LTDPLACSVHAVGRTDPSSAGSVLVYGAGVLGLGVVWALRATGYAGRIDVVARHEHQGRLARRFGATDVLFLSAGRAARFESIARRTGGRVVRARLGNVMLSGGYDVVFECVGHQETIEEALKWARSRGQVIMVGMGDGRGSDMTPVWFGELTVVGVSGRGQEDLSGRGPLAAERGASRGQGIHTYRLVHQLMLSGGPDVSCLLTHTFELAEYKAALWAAMDKRTHRSVKVAFRLPAARPGGNRA
jgi:threonine dehydrogenase-like Zn-dependent dehydrogenase